MLDDSIFPEKMYFVFKRWLKLKNKKDKNITFIDVGAAEGIFSVAVLKEFSDANILLFEPEDERLEVLIENIEKIHKEDHNIEIQQKIVASKTSKKFVLKEFTDSINFKPAGSSTIFEQENEKRTVHEYQYQSIKLDDFKNKYDNIDAIKIDVEGGELEVLKGCIELIREKKPIIFLEIHSGKRFGNIEIDDVKKIFGNLKNEYNFKLINDHWEHFPNIFTGEIFKEKILEYYIISPKRENK